MPSSFQASRFTHMLNNQCVTVRGETHLPRQKSLAITALRNVKSFSTIQAAHALQPWSERVKQRRHWAHTRKQRRGLAALMQAVLPRATWRGKFLSPFQQHSQRGTATSEPRKRSEGEKCYLLAKYPYQQRGSTISYNKNDSYTKFFYSQRSYILSKVGKKINQSWWN